MRVVTSTKVRCEGSKWIQHKNKALNCEPLLLRRLVVLNSSTLLHSQRRVMLGKEYLDSGFELHKLRQHCVRSTPTNRAICLQPCLATWLNFFANLNEPVFAFDDMRK